MNTLKNIIKHLVRTEATKRKKLHLLAHIEPVTRLNLKPEVLFSGIVSDLDLQILVRSYVEGATQSEIAQELGISVDAVKKRSQRAKKKMREEIEKF